MTSQRSSSTEVASRVHRLRLIGATAYVILEDEITVIDAGLRGSLSRLHAWITSVGRSPREVRRFVITHAHPDHIGGAAGADILLHPADRARSLRLNAGAIARRFSRLPATVDLADGDVLPVLGGLRVIHTPGHTPGSVCLYAEREGLLVVGDALWRDDDGAVHPPNPYWSEDLRSARRSLDRLGGLAIGTVLFAHRPPLERADRALRELSERWR
ncbi:MAG TPA: MBL fold metallo-hydrolase [Candidatus Bathyarchaeia archaeon]|nr:MBL fold metallo-hydrolase [Candidatus Bathyarchaeia archaeon]